MEAFRIGQRIFKGFVYVYFVLRRMDIGYLDIDVRRILYFAFVFFWNALAGIEHVPYRLNYAIQFRIGGELLQLFDKPLVVVVAYGFKKIFKNPIVFITAVDILNVRTADIGFWFGFLLRLFVYRIFAIFEQKPPHIRRNRNNL